MKSLNKTFCVHISKSVQYRDFPISISLTKSLSLFLYFMTGVGESQLFHLLLLNTIFNVRL